MKRTMVHAQDLRLMMRPVRGGYLDAMRRSVDFKGRSSLSAYWQFIVMCLAMTIAAHGLGAIMSLFGLRGDALGRVGEWLVRVVHLLPAISLMARRAHDIDRSAWIMLAPIRNMRLAFTAGTPGPNRYGEEPR